ncbi:MAG TPA: ScpA family protein, partial [Dehalococcoidia bacterium]|nr:ScpA family protein [Dehalococcoidia bacterium]
LIQVTDQYIALLRAQTPSDGEPATSSTSQFGRIDLRALADFVAVGAKLLFLKSRALLPRTPEQIAEDELTAEEIATDLTAQLEEYRAFKNAASYLRDLEESGHRSFTRIAPPPADWAPTGLEQVTMKKLLAALAKALERLPPAPEPERLQRQVLNIAERRVNLLAIVRRTGSLPFTRIIAECRTRFEAIITFMAILDLMKTEDLQAEQTSAFGEIMLTTTGHSPHTAAGTA